MASYFYQEQVAETKSEHDALKGKYSEQINKFNLLKWQVDPAYAKEVEIQTDPLKRGKYTWHPSLTDHSKWFINQYSHSVAGNIHIAF